jgi:hypothetical protein
MNFKVTKTKIEKQAGKRKKGDRYLPTGSTAPAINQINSLTPPLPHSHFLTLCHKNP